MVVTEEGIVTLARLLQPENAQSPIYVTKEGIEYASLFPPGYMIIVRLFLSNSTPSALE
jgi:hypothetical protein